MRRERTEEDGEGILAHGVDEDGAIVDLIEFGCVHEIEDGSASEKLRFGETVTGRSVGQE